MFKIKDIFESYFYPNKLKQSYRDKIRRTKKAVEIDWEERSVEAAKSVIAAVCFKESAGSLLTREENLLYPPIGYYYAIFHLSVGLLKLDYSIDLNQLKNIHHSTLINTFESKLVTTKIISNEYINSFKNLRDIREYCNYRFGYSDDLMKKLKHMDKLTEKCFDEGMMFIHQVLQESGGLFRFQVSIGDSFGDDIIDTYLSGEEREKIWNYLVLNSLTT